MSSILSLLFLLNADIYTQTFAEGNTAYQQANYTDAVASYQRLIDSRVAAPEVFYNLGNAYYRMGDLGRAVTSYERALQEAPTFRPAQQNLHQALRSSKQNLDRPMEAAWRQALFFWDDSFSLTLVRNMSLVFWVLAWSLLALRQWCFFRFGRVIAGVLMVAALLFTGSTWGKMYPIPLAVAANETVAVHFGPSEEEMVRFKLVEGNRVAVEGTNKGWVRIATVSKERGWVRERDLHFVGPPYYTLKPLETDENLNE